MFPILQVGPLAIQLPGLLLLAGVWVGSAMIEREGAETQALRRELLEAWCSTGWWPACLGPASATRCVIGPSTPKIPRGLVSLNPNTLSAAEGLAASLLVGLVLARRHRLPLWSTLDAFAPGLAAFAVSGEFGRSFEWKRVWRPESLPWAIELWGAVLDPSQIYAILLAVAVVVAIRRLGRRPAFSGLLFLAWLAMTAAGRLFLEAFQGDSVVALGLSAGRPVDQPDRFGRGSRWDARPGEGSAERLTRPERDITG